MKYKIIRMQAMTLFLKKIFVTPCLRKQLLISANFVKLSI